MADPITRFDLEFAPSLVGSDSSMVEHPEGDYIYHADHARVIAALTRERDEARAALALAYPRALQAAASEVQALLDDENETDGLDMEAILLTAKDCILALTPEDIDRITKEHEHG